MTIYDYIVKDGKGNDVKLDKYKGKVLLIVNTATACGLTPQYEGLQALYDLNKDKGLEILDFPCNQFLGQAPGTDDEIKTFCEAKYHTTFDRFKKIDVNGENTDPLYTFLKSAHPEDVENGATQGLLDKLKSLAQSVTGDSIKWNFTKFLVDKNGNVVARFSPTTQSEELAVEIAKYL